MPKGKPVGDFSAFLNQLVASLSRFYKSGTVFFAADFPSPFELRSASELRIELPSQDVYTDLRSKWKGKNYEKLPLKGVCMLDDEIGTANSLVTIKFACKPLENGPQLPYPAQLTEAILSDANNTPYGYISEYSYSFYPDLRSSRARDIGYVRYDFHPEVMGNGDTGGHPYFHFHAGHSGEEMEEVELQARLEKPSPLENKEELRAAAQAIESEVRLPTGLTMPEAFITTLEYKLAPKMRQKRIDDALSALNWYYLMLDLTPLALKKRMIEKHGKKEWHKLSQSDSCKASMRKAGWHAGLFYDE